MSNIQKELTEKKDPEDNPDPVSEESEAADPVRTFASPSNPEQVQLAKLQEVERRFQTVFEAAPIGIAIAKEVSRGTGLGLASAYGIIKNHNGMIEVTSEKGNGTTVTIYLPKSAKDFVEEKPAIEQAIKGRETILLVDDEEMVADVGTKMLQKLGYRVMLAESGRKAIQKFEKLHSRIDLVILDMIMPEMGGSETFDQLKAIAPDIKVLLSSGYSLDGQASQIMKRGCNGFIQKPFNLKHFSQKVREILDE